MSQNGTSKKNSIKPREHGVDVMLDPAFLLSHALYMPDGETVVKSNMTLGQAIEAIAFAHIMGKTPELANRCKHARIEFKEGKFHVNFADRLDNLIAWFMK